MAGKDEKTKLMVRVAKMNYLYGMSQKHIAEQLGISRGYVCQLLDAARAQGIVTIQVHDPASAASEVEQNLCRRFGLRRAIVVDVPEVDDNRGILHVELVGEVNAYLETIIQSGAGIAFSWGRTVYQIAQNMRNMPSVRDIYAVPLCGGTNNLNKNIYVSEISTSIARAYNGTPLSLPLPVVLESAAVKQVVCNDAAVLAVLEKIAAADVALFTVGEFGKTNSIYLGGYMDDALLRKLEALGSVGDMFGHFISEDGTISDPSLEERTVSIALDQFAAIPNKVCVVSGIQKVRPLLAVLCKGYVDVLITTRPVVDAMLELI